MVIFKWLLNLLKCLIYHIIKDKKVCLRRVWIRLTTACLLCAREFRQNNALALQFWCLSNAFTRPVASLTVLGGQEFHFPHFFLKFWSIFVIFPQTLLIFFLILALRVGKSPTREGPGYATGTHPPGSCTWRIKISARVHYFV